MRTQHNTVTIDYPISESEQLDAFQNATLQTIDKHAVSIACYVDLPGDTPPAEAPGQLAGSLREILVTAAEQVRRVHPGVVLGFEVQIGEEEANR